SYVLVGVFFSAAIASALPTLRSVEAAGTLTTCPGAQFQFPIIDGTIGWIYLDPRSKNFDPSQDPSGRHIHSGVDIQPPGGNADQAEVYPMAGGFLREVGYANPTSLEIYYPAQGVTSYMTHVVLGRGKDGRVLLDADGQPLANGARVSPTSPIGHL